MSNNERRDNQSRISNKLTNGNNQHSLTKDSANEGKLKIVQFNANTLYNKQEEIKKFIIDDLQPDKVAFNETKL